MPITRLRKTTTRADPMPRRSALTAAARGDTFTAYRHYTSPTSNPAPVLRRDAGILNVPARAAGDHEVRWTPDALRARLRAWSVLNMVAGTVPVRTARSVSPPVEIISQVDRGELPPDGAAELLDRSAKRMGPPRPT